jgi:flagellar protein FlaG
MEIQPKQNVMPTAAPALESSVAKGQDVPKPGSVMPPVELKASPKVPEFKKQDLVQAMKELQEFVDALGRDLNFRVDEGINRSIITVRDATTKQVVRQIPAEEIVSIARQITDSLREIRAGLLMNDEA